VSHQSSSTPTRSRPAAINTVGKIIETYDYPDEQGNLIFQVLRFDPKDLRQRRPARPDDDPKKVRDGGWVWEVRGERPVPYRLPEVREAIALGRPIWVVEGEKDADNLWRLGIPATCNAGGVGKWSEEHSEFFRGVDVIIVQDNDPQARIRLRPMVTAHYVGIQMAGRFYRARITPKPLQGLFLESQCGCA
jgi:hypothetical protein